LQRPSGMPGSSSYSPGDVSISSPASGPGVESPATGPWNYPAVPGLSPYDQSPITEAAIIGNNNLILFIGAALITLFFVWKKHH
jgi:hypothetical protein